MTSAPRWASKPTILIIWANPVGTSSVNAPDEVKNIIRIAEPTFHVEELPAARPVEIREWINKYKPTIVHWSGHGMPPSSADGARTRDLSPSGERATLVAEGKEGRPWVITNDALAELFKFLKEKGNAPRCVVLNACFTEDQAEAIAPHVPFVVGTTRPIENDQAITFSEKFYGALVAGASLGEAFQAAKIDVDLSPREHTGKDGDKRDLLIHKALNPKAKKVRLRRRIWPAIAGVGSTVGALMVALIAWFIEPKPPVVECDGGLCPDAGVAATADASKVAACVATCCSYGAIDCSKRGCPSGNACIPYPCNADLPENDKFELRVSALVHVNGSVPERADVCLRHAVDPEKIGWQCWPTVNGVATTQTSTQQVPLEFTIRELLTSGVEVEVRPTKGALIRASHAVTVPTPQKGQPPGLHAKTLCVGWTMHVTEHDAGADNYDLLVFLDGPR